jgi:replicative DNA helicase
MSSKVPSPPWNHEAEERVLGTLLVFYKPELVTMVQATGLRWDDFYRSSHQVVYRAVLKMHFGGEWVEVGTVARFLSCQRTGDESWLERAGGRATLEALSCAASVNGFRDYARIVAEEGRWRRWLGAMFDALESIDSRDEDGFWAAVGRVREDVLPSELRVVEGGKEKAA